jgi:NAD-reducing hydrogenase small subunit
MIHTVRARTKVLASLGDCAVTGNVTALRNLIPLDEVLRAAYVERATAQPQVPLDDVVPALLPRVEPVHKVVPVDVFIPGCPPSADRIWTAISALLEGKTPAWGGDLPAPRFG